MSLIFFQSSPRPSPRVSQLRQEECLDIARSEAAHEKEIHSAIQMSQSCEDLTLVAGNLSCSDVGSIFFNFIHELLFY